MANRILYIDDESDSLVFRSKADLLLDAGYEVTSMRLVSDVLARLDRGGLDVDAIVLDILMPPGKSYTPELTNHGTVTGLLLLADIRKKMPSIPIIIVSVKDRSEMEADIQRYHVAAYLKKPVIPSDIADAIGKAIGPTGDASGRRR